MKYEIPEEKVLVVKEDADLVYKTKQIIQKGNSVEIKKGTDGKIKVLEVVKKIK